MSQVLLWCLAVITPSQSLFDTTTSANPTIATLRRPPTVWRRVSGGYEWVLCLRGSYNVVPFPVNDITAPANPSIARLQEIAKDATSLD